VAAATRTIQITRDKYNKRSISAGEMYLMISVEWAADHSGIGLTQIDPLLTKPCKEGDFHIFVPNDFDI